MRSYCNNKKGFTLTELLVVVVILGIVSGLSIPLIRNLTTTFERKKYESYADSVLAASKIYNDSYSEDLFGHNDYGCAYLPYEKLVEKKLIKDIQIDDRSCNSSKTYVRILKQKDKYAYTVYLGCGKNINGKVSKVDLSIPEDIPEMNPAVCTGVDESNLIITTVDAQTGGVSDKNRKKTKLKIESATGINSNMIIYAKWSKDAHDFANTGFGKVSFKVKNNQEKSISEGNIIESLSDEIITPKSTGPHYLIVRVDRLEDLYGHQWKNTQDAASKYMVFGPFLIDSTEPIITANIYKCKKQADSYVKTGEVVATKTVTKGEGTFNLSSMTGTVQGWASSKSFEDGVCIEFLLSDESSIKSATWQWNASGLKENATGYKTLPAENNSPKTYGGERSVILDKSLTADGHRYAKLTLKDFAGNKTILNIDLKLDKTAPTKPTINNSSNGKWTEQDVTLGLASTDAMSGMKDYYYTYNENATEIGTSGNESYNKWIKLNGGTGKTSFTTEKWNTDINETTYIRSCDVAGNCSEKNSTEIKIDRQVPTITAKVYASTSNQEKATTTPLRTSAIDLSGTNNTMNLSNLANNVNGWLNSENYPYGVYLEIELKDNLALGTTKWEWNTSGQKENASGYKNLTGNKNYTYPNEKTTTATSSNVVSADGHRYVKFTVTDKFGHETSIYFDFKLDKTKPNKPTLDNPSGGDWVNHNFDLTIKSSDAMSGIGKYYYTYTNEPSGFGDNDRSQWVKYSTENVNTLVDTWSSERDDTVYIISCDKAGNCSEKSSTRIRIDRTDPGCGYVDYYDWSQYESYGVFGDVGCYDDGSGCVSAGYFEYATEDGYVEIEDHAGNYNYCEIDIESECVDGHCGSYFVPVCIGKYGGNIGNGTDHEYTEDDCQSWCGGTNGIDYKWVRNDINVYGHVIAACHTDGDSSSIANCVWGTWDKQILLYDWENDDFYDRAGNTWNDYYSIRGCCGCCFNNQVVCDEYIYW